MGSLPGAERVIAPGRFEVYDEPHPEAGSSMV
jgi:hypothetical protein